MKKTALSLSLLLSLVAGCMVGCNKVQTKTQDGNEVLFKVGDTTVTTSDLLGFTDSTNAYDFLNTDAGVKAVYEAVYKALAQKNIEVTPAIEGAVKEKMDDWNDQVANYASANGVTTRNAEKTLLEQAGVASVKELEASYILEEQKEELENQFSSKNTEPSLTGANGSSLLERYVKETSPMIVKHILVKTEDTNGLHNKGSITFKEVDKLTTVMGRLALGKAGRNSFKNIAVEESDDGSNTKGGNLGIMDTYTAFTSEFKLNLYAAEVINHKDAFKAGTYDADDTFGIKQFTEDLFGASGLYPDYTVTKSVDVGILASVLAYVGEDLNVARQTAENHLTEADYDAQLYPRNMLYNKYLNYPGIQYLTIDLPDSESGDLSVATAKIESLIKEVYPNLDPTDAADLAKINAKVDGVKDSEFFKAFLSINQKTAEINGQKVVVDENNNPIILAKSAFGLHFMSVTWSALDHANGSEGVPSDAVKYFMYGSNASSLTNTYVKSSDYNLGYSTTTVAQNSRKSEIEGRIHSYITGAYENIVDNHDLHEHEIFNYYLGNSQITIPNEKLKAAIEEYIDRAFSYQATSISDSQEVSWYSYIKSVEANLEIHDLLY